MTPMTFSAPTHASYNLQHTNQQPTTTQRNQAAQLDRIAPVRVYSGPAIHRHSANNLRQSTTSIHLWEEAPKPETNPRITIEKKGNGKTKFDCKERFITDHHAKTIMEEIFKTSLPYRLEIDLSDNLLTSAFTEDLASILKGNINKIVFMTINLSKNLITDDGLSSLATAFTEMPASLASIQIDIDRDNFLTSEENHQALAKAIVDSGKKQSALIDDLFMD